MTRMIHRFFLPHPPAAVDAIQGNKKELLNNTIEGFRNAAKKIAEQKPKVIVIITPHGPCFGDHYYIPSQKRISGDFSAYGNKKLILGFDCDLDLAERIHEKAAEKGLSAGFVDDKTMKRNGISYDLDHGILVPMYFICQYYQDFKLLPISLSGQNGKHHYKMGIVLREAIKEYPEDVAIIASGNLSHKATEEHGAAFDKKLKKLLLAENIPRILDFDPEQKEQAEQCGLDSCRMLLGTLDGFDFYTNILAYEHPLGTGYLSAEFHCGKPKESALVYYLAEEETRLQQRWAAESPVVQLSRKAISAYLKDKKEITLDTNTPESLKAESCGVFVTLKNDGRIRGNAGTTMATQPSLGEEIIYHAIRALKSDMTDPITEEELKDLSIEVCTLSEPEEISNQQQLNPQTYGLILESKKRCAVLLPGLPHIDTPEKQIQAAKAQAGIHPWHRTKLKRFTVTRYK